MLIQYNGLRGWNTPKYLVWDDYGKVCLGNFCVEFFKGNKASIHSFLEEEYRSKGFGREMYDEAEKMLSFLGLRFVPSPHLSRHSLRIWKARSPEKLRNHIVYNDGADLENKSAYYPKPKTIRIC